MISIPSTIISVSQSLVVNRKQDSSAPVEKRQFGTVEKDSSAPRMFGIRTNRHRIFFQTNVITFFKIKSTKKNPSMIV